MKVTVLIADDEPVALGGLRNMLAEVEWISIVGEVSRRMAARCSNLSGMPCWLMRVSISWTQHAHGPMQPLIQGGDAARPDTTLLHDFLKVLFRRSSQLLRGDLVNQVEQAI